MIPKRYENAGYEDVPEKIRIALEDGIKRGRGLYIYGAVGSGKTHIAYAIYKKACEEKIIEVEEEGVKRQYITHPFKRGVRFFNTTELLHEIRADFSRDQRTKIEPENEILQNKSSIIIFDDIGAEKATDWVAETLYLMVNKQYENVTPVIFTSNLKIDELAEKIGDRTVSRIVEMCEIINLEGGDRRIVRK